MNIHNFHFPSPFFPIFLFAKLNCLGFIAIFFINCFQIYWLGFIAQTFIGIIDLRYIFSPDTWISPSFLFLTIFPLSHPFFLFLRSTVLRSNISMISESLHELKVSVYLDSTGLCPGSKTSSVLPALSSSYKGFNSLLFKDLKI